MAPKLQRGLMGGFVNRRRRGDGAASLVEFALLLPVFAMLLFGMISVGLALNEKQEMTHATREGARYAATVPAGQSFTAGTWAQNVRDLIIDRSAGTLEAADICVSLVEGSPGTVVTPAATYSTSGGSCIAGQTYPTTVNDTGRRVQVTGVKDAAIDLLLFGSFTVTMKTDATAKSESNS